MMDEKKLYQRGLGNRLENSLKFMGSNCIYDDDNMAIHRIRSKHHKALRDWNVGYRNKYASFKWINDTRGCGFGCIVAKKRFIY